MITSAANRLRRTRKKARRDDHALGLFVIEKKKAEDGRWCVISTRRTVRAAQDCVWDLLTREGGEVRVRQGGRVVAKGASCEGPDVPPRSAPTD